METAQQVGQGMLGDGFVFLIIGVIVIFFGLKTAVSGTLSEDAQKRNHKRDRGWKE